MPRGAPPGGATSHGRGSPGAAAPCRWIRSKESYVRSDRSGSDPVLDRMDEGSPVVYWCVKTMAGKGPDRSRVDAAACVAGRSCYA